MDFKRTTTKSWEEIKKRVGEFSLIPQEKQVELFQRYKQTGDIKARDKLLTSNLRVIMKKVGMHIRSGVPREDLFEEGVGAFYDALESYNPDKGNFVGYLATAVSWRLTNFVRKWRRDPSFFSRSLHEPLYERFGDPDLSLEETIAGEEQEVGGDSPATTLAEKIETAFSKYVAASRDSGQRDLRELHVKLLRLKYFGSISRTWEEIAQYFDISPQHCAFLVVSARRGLKPFLVKELNKTSGMVKKTGGATQRAKACRESGPPEPLSASLLEREYTLRELRDLIYEHEMVSKNGKPVQKESPYNLLRWFSMRKYFSFLVAQNGNISRRNGEVLEERVTLGDVLRFYVSPKNLWIKHRLYPFLVNEFGSPEILEEHADVLRKNRYK